MASKKAREKEIAAVATSLNDEDLVELITSADGWQRAIDDFSGNSVEYPADPTQFMTEVLGYKVWGKLGDILNSVRDNHDTVVASGFGVGKSVVAAALACWYISTHDPAVVITLAPTWNQVNSIIWRYIRSVGRKAGLPGRIMETPRWEITTEKYAYGLSPRKSTEADMASLQGRHAPNQLIIMDEAAGLPRKIWETVQGLAVSENNRVLAIGNPIEQAGPFYEACVSPHWNHIRISCMEHPNVIYGRDAIPGAVSRSWIEQRAEEWATPCEPKTPGGVNLWWCDKWVYPLPVFTAKVLGIAPEQSDDQLISMSWVNAAQNTFQPMGDDTTLACDPAPRAGDDTAIAIRSGNRIIEVVRRKTHTTGAVVGFIRQMMLMHNVDAVIIDEGGSGIGVVDECRRQSITVRAVNGASGSTQKKRFSNLRSQMWWNLREALRKGLVQLPVDTMLEADLTAVRWGSDLYQRILLEDKEETKKRIKRSPDSGDAVALLFAHGQGLDENVDMREVQTGLTSAGENYEGSRWTVSVARKMGVSKWRR